MRLDPAAFNQFLAGIGQEVEWRRSFACPCFNPTSAAPLMSCKHCGGKGRIWEGAVRTVIGVAGRDAQKAWRDFGQYEDGDQLVIVGSDSPAYGLGPYDRILSLNRTEPFSMRLARGVNDRLEFPVESIDRVLFMAGDELREAPAPRVLHSGGLEWDADGPPAHATYTVTGRRRAEFFVFQDQPFDRPHHSGATLPRRVVLRRFDLYSR